MATDSNSNERDAIISETANALRVVEMEGLRDSMQVLRPQKKSTATTNASSEEEGGEVTLQSRVNPFTYEDRVDAWELVKICLGVVVVPLRLFMAIVLLLLGAFIFKISEIGFDQSKPIGPCRRLVFRVAVSRTISRGLLFCMGILSIRFKGRPAPSKSPWQGRMVVAAPHSTFLDGFIMQYAMDFCSIVAKKEASNGLMGVFFRGFQSILVDRKSKESKKGAMQAIIERVQSELPWQHLVIFPEGTCTNRRALINFKNGPFAPARPVQPVLLRWDRNVNFNPVWTVGGPSRTWLIYRFLCQVYISVDVEFLPVYVPNEVEREDPALFAAGVRNAMSRALNIPVTEHSYEDSFLAALARKKHLNPQTALPHEYVQLAKLCNVNYEEATRLMKRFTEVKLRRKQHHFPTPDPTKVGAPPSSSQVDLTSDRLTLEEFAELLGLPLTEPVIEFFAVLDVSGEGSIDFPAFLVGLTFISHDTSLEDAARVIWKTLDREDKGEVNVKHIRKVLDMVFRRVDNRAIPLLRETKGKTTINFDEFLALLRLHPEYVPIALHVTSLGVKERPQKRMSIATATTTLSHKQTVVEDGIEVVDRRVAAAADLPDRHISFQPVSHADEESRMG